MRAKAPETLSKMLEAGIETTIPLAEFEEEFVARLVDALSLLGP
jgi:hypothetical protein